ncbi:mono-functional DNA-alkylating methyl methanesulfonate N-term-domain-containing protein [Apodospora peruviana]|uniref:Mono-functional DNA-alkylating methyl methanesulfonate N-term-domain-containing protein n=1 Tax=Apodospora peruviana TaxID=516989 RepID=A0AAE0M4F2_9PEZI|nr:mono-functional DNA-alkylating methyl methanesulfonate N-term-domain-containing protein [Apodospora peruviana]
MAFQTNVFRGGEWVTETVDLQSLLKANSGAKGPKRPRLLKPPQCGILTGTVLESPLINTILPVRLRSTRHNDVAFIGNRSVRILELPEDGHLVEIASKQDFGSRIRNACVIGSFQITANHDDKSSIPLGVPTQEGGLPPSSFSPPPTTLGLTSSQLPPQLLVVVLECGTCVFLYLHQTTDSSFEFVTLHATKPKPRFLYTGFHLAVDPSSRYMALASHQDHFAVYELESLENLNRDHNSNRPLNPIRSYRPRTVQGVVHKITFLHPRPGDDRHIILLLIIVKNSKSRMVIYEWELGDNLKVVFGEEKHGYRMPVENQMPTVLIPLTVRSAFMAISQDQIAVCTQGLHGPPVFESFELQPPLPTEIHFGRAPPLWTAWARPLRLPGFFHHHDIIYLAREDGVVMFIEFDEDGTMLKSYKLETFDCNISSAFACVYDQYVDSLLFGGDTGPGAVWRVPPRDTLQLLGTLPTMAPTVDFVTTDEFSTWNQRISTRGNKTMSLQEHTPKRRHRIFAASGRGKKGAIAEIRFGLGAEIDLEFEFGPGIKQTWLFPSQLHDGLGGFDLLVSMPNSSSVLHFPEDFSEVSELDPSAVPYELSCSTLAFNYSDNHLVHITQHSVLLLAQNKSARFYFDQILPNHSDSAVADACILDNRVACSTYTDSKYAIHTFEIDLAEFSLPHLRTFDVDGEVTCLITTCDSVVAGIWKDGKPFLATYAHSTPSVVQMIDLLDLLPSGLISGLQKENHTEMEPIASIVCADNTFLLGTRSGEVLTLAYVANDFVIDVQKFGMTTAYITSSRAHYAKSIDPTVFVCCDTNLVMMQPTPSYSSSPGSTPCPVNFQPFQVWPVDNNNLAAPAPPVDFGVAADLPSDGCNFTKILMVSGSKLLLARLHHKPGAVHRQIPIEGRPTRLIYSPTLQCLVSAVTKDDRPTLMFIDPDTGEDIGRPTDKTGNRVDHIGGLGKLGDSIFGLTEWRFRRERGVWDFLLVATRAGRLVVLSTEKGEPRNGGLRPIRYWTTFLHKEPGLPIYSVVGHDDGLVYCAGNTIHWYVLNTETKRLNRLKSFDLSCPVTSLQVVNGEVLALTIRDSLVTVEHSLEESGPTGLSHADPKPRTAVHMIEVAGTQPEETLGGITLVSDQEGGVGGLWVPWQTPQKDCEPVFEAELPSSIRRFRLGRTRPTWGNALHTPRYGRLVSTVDDSDILGISLDGSMYHFTLLNMDIWRVLRLIQNIALTSPDLYPFTYQRVADMAEFDPEPKAEKGLEMQVDGDMLKRCLDQRALQGLLSHPCHAARFMELLDQLEEGKHTAQLSSAGSSKMEDYVLLTYEIIEYFLQRPF